MTTLCKSDFYHGSYREVDNYCEAYMTPEEHEELKKISKKYTRHYSSDKNYFIFSGLLVCPICGLKMESQSQINTIGNRYYYYRCYDTYRTGKCTFKGNVNEKAIESYLLTQIHAQIDANSKRVQYSSTKHKKVVDLGKYKAEMERLTSAYIKGRIEESYYDTEYAKLQQIIHEHELQSEPNVQYDTEKLKEIFNSEWVEMYVNLNRENKRAFWRKTIQKITFNEDKTVNTVYFL